MQRWYRVFLGIADSVFPKHLTLLWYMKVKKKGAYIYVYMLIYAIYTIPSIIVTKS